MAPQTILAAAASATNNATASNTATNKLKQQQSAQKALPLNACNNTANNNNNMNTKLPSLQKIGAQQSASATTQPIWPWNAPSQNTSAASAAPHSKKRNSTLSSDGLIKKSRTSNGNAQTSTAATHPNAVQAISNASQMVNASKRLKAVALEESQTKITGYFKSQMKAQQLLSKRQEFVPNSSGVSSGMTTTALTMSTPATTASLNKYFNILSQIKENNSQREQQHQQQQQKVAQAPSTTSAAGNLPNSITITPTPSTALPVPALKKIERSKPTKIAQVAPNLRKPNNSTSNSNYVAAANLVGKSPKKHVAIAPRTPDMKPNQMNNKEIAPKQQQPAVLLTAIRMPTTTGGTQQPQATAAPMQQQQAIANVQTASLKQQSVTAAAVKMPATTVNAANPANTTLYQLPLQLPNLVQLPQLLAAANGANIMQLNNAVNKSTAQAAAAAATTAQAAQAAAAQYFLNGTVFKLQQFTTATTTTATSAVATASGTPANINPFSFMHANDLQELFIKQQQQLQHQQQLQLQQQQKNVATASAAVNATNFQEIFQQQVAAAVAANQQQQQQQQFQQLQRLNAAANNMQQPVFMATPAGLLLNAASLPAMLAQAAAAIAANNNQQQQHQQQQQQQQQKAIAMQQQQLPALQPIQAAMPALSSIFGQSVLPASQQALEQNVHELQQQQQQQFQQQIAMAHQQQQQHQQQQLQQQQQHQSFVTTTQPPPLSVVSTSSTPNSSLTPVPTAKLAIVKANSAQFPPLNSQPPPLVTISSGSASTKQRAASTTASITQTKPSALAKPYQKRAPKTNATQNATKALSNTTSKAGKISTPTSKIVASPTTPPPLVPAFSCNSNSILATPLNSIASTTTQQASTVAISTSKPTPALVSIASATNPPVAKLTTSTSMSTTTCTTTSLVNSNTPHTEQKISSTTAIAAAKDLFDIVKNSEYPPITTTTTSTLCSLFTKIKEEPLDEPQQETTEESSDKSDMAIFSTNLPAAIKLEFMEDSSKMSTSNPSALQDCSSSSFCSHSNSVSSSADLSLEASTAASLTSSAPSPAPSTESTSAEPVSACDSNSNSCATTTAASLATSQDQLNDLSTMSSSASSTSSSASSSSATATNSCSLHLSLSASINAKSKETLSKRDLPTPESGLGGSLSNSESSNSLASSSSQSSSSSSKACSPDLEITNCMSNSMSNSMSNMSQTTTATDSTTESISIESQTFTPPPSMCSMFIIPTTIDTQLAELSSMSLPKAAISPILSQPKTIRFPAASGFRYGHKGAKRHDGVCYWHKCNKKHDSSSKLLDHMQTNHVNSQTGPFSCLWVGCKVYNKESCSRRWLERHVLSHGGSKQFKCIVEGCGLRFGSQLALQKHVNNHFTATENKESTNKRTSDPPVPKQLRKNGKKLRYRRQPFSARMFDFFDTGIMEGLNHRLRQISTLTDGRNNITFQGQCMMRRKNLKGVSECFVRWSPREIISDEWLPECAEPYVKTVNIKQMRPAEKTKVESLLMTAYRLPYASNLFANDFVIEKTTASNYEQKSDAEEESIAEDSDEDDDNDNDDENEISSILETETNASSTTVSSYPLTIAKLEMQQRKKHPRKPQKRMPIISATEKQQKQQQKEQ